MLREVCRTITRHHQLLEVWFAECGAGLSTIPSRNVHALIPDRVKSRLNFLFMPCGNVSNRMDPDHSAYYADR